MKLTAVWRQQVHTSASSRNGLCESPCMSTASIGTHFVAYTEMQTPERRNQGMKDDAAGKGCSLTILIPWKQPSWLACPSALYISLAATLDLQYQICASPAISGRAKRSREAIRNSSLGLDGGGGTRERCDWCRGGGLRSTARSLPSGGGGAKGGLRWTCCFGNSGWSSDLDDWAETKSWPFLGLATALHMKERTEDLFRTQELYCKQSNSRSSSL